MSDSNIFADREEEKPMSYSDPEALKIELCSAGRLSAPPILNVTDYRMEDVIKLSMISEDNIIKNLLEVLQARVQEDFDVRKLHENEMEEILLNIYVNFWSRIILDYPYPWTEKELDELLETGIISQNRYDRIKEKKEIPTTDINLSNVVINEISEDFKEPIFISKDKDNGFGMRLSRVGDFLLAEEYTKKKFSVQDKRFSDVKIAIQSEDITKIEGERVKAYIDYERQRAVSFLEYKQALLISFVKKDGQKKVVTTIEEKVHEYRKMPKTVWDLYNDKVEKMKFGANHDVEMISPFTKQPVIRRCLFQVMDFIPTNIVSDSSGYSISFGDENEAE